MSEALDPAMQRTEQNYLSMSIEKMPPQIKKMLFEHLSGCWKQCPFCKAVCTKTFHTHEGDLSVLFHHPQAVNGQGWHETDHFLIECCLSVARGVYATWHITSDSSTQPYWKWLVCHFRVKLEEKYQKKFIDKGEIPDAWTKITKQNVLEENDKGEIPDAWTKITKQNVLDNSKKQ
ncbi:hypothetical protein HPG69_005845 [Diceros bicornis minor]|uniref:Uncharacterized protein n=1 Tax=Diceros bicornis minor TaxID=77932 RepID=A0A7J7ESW4_DICBM|nr:hypothetical protein HPG69_005845 [Diceros bicornis minor]